jgi:CRP/FNR family transcriptional regulator, anaerobic regulatory protein
MSVPAAMPAWQGAVDCEGCAFRQYGLFADLTAHDLARNLFPIDRLNLRTGDALYREGDRGLAVFSIVGGVVKLEQDSPSGIRRIVRLQRTSDAVGLEALLGHDYEHTAVALRPITVCRIPTTAIEQMSQHSPLLVRQLMVRWHQAVQQADLCLTLLSTGSARARVARLLLYLLGNDPGRTCDGLTREDMAALLGITIETASRVIAEFRRRAVITALPSNRFLLDPRALREIAEN